MEKARGNNTQYRVCAMSGNTVSSYDQTILSVIAREYGSMRHAAKILARHARASSRTAEAWLSGRNVPKGENFLNLMAECDALADAINTNITERKALRGE